MKCDIYNSKGIHVGLVIGPAIFDLTGKLLYELKGTKIYRTSGELVGHLHDASGFGCSAFLSASNFAITTSMLSSLVLSIT